MQTQTSIINSSQSSQTMSEIIKLPCFTTPTTLHFGSSDKYAEHSKCGSYFIECAHTDESENPNNKKHIITSVKYEPDGTYRMTDGHAGKCWIVGVEDAEKGTFSNYYIRNWCDLVCHYAMEMRLEFVDRTKLIRR